MAGVPAASKISSPSSGSREARQSRRVGPIGLGLAIGLLILTLGREASAQAYQVSTDTKGMTSIAGEPGVQTFFASSPGVQTRDATTIPLPFDFEYFGQVFAAGTPVTLVTQGYITLGDNLARLGPNTNAGGLPQGGLSLPDVMIAPFWISASARPSSRMQVLTRGVTGSRELVVEWHDYFNGSDATTVVTGQAALFEGTNAIEFRYDVTCQAGMVKVGIERPGGSEAFLPFGSGLVASPAENVRFAVPSPTDLSGAASFQQTHIRPGDTVVLTRTLFNVGVPSPTVTIRYVATADLNIDVTDPVLATETLTGLTGNLSGTVSLTLPATLPFAGTPPRLRVAMVVDPDDAVAENNETNNVSFVTLLPKPDARYLRQVLPRAPFQSILGTGETRHFDGLTAPADDASVVVPLPFSMPFFERVYNDVRISVDGILTFDKAVSDSQLRSNLALLTNNSAVRSMMAPFWDDLEVEAGTAGVVASKVEGAPGSRVFIVEWSHLEKGKDDVAPVGDVTFQCHLHEDGVIEFHYPDPQMQDVLAVFSHTSGVAVAADEEGYGGVDYVPSNKVPDATFRYEPVTTTLPELEASLLLIPQSHADPGMLSVRRAFANRGAALAAPVELRIVASTDGAIDAGDLLVHSEMVQPGPGLAVDGEITITIPDTLIAGPVTLGLLIDPTDAVTERDETDNAAAAPTLLELGAARYRREELAPSFTSILGQSGTVVLFSGQGAGQGPANDQVTSLGLGFTFPYFGQGYGSVDISTEGTLLIGGADTTFAGQLRSNGPLPIANNLNRIVAPLWGDLEVKAGSSAVIAARIVGVVGTRSLTVEWNRVEPSGSLAGELTFQARIVETGEISFHYAPSAMPALDAGVDLTVGIEGPLGQEAYGGPSLDRIFGEVPSATYRFTPMAPTGPDLLLRAQAVDPDQTAAGTTTAAVLEVENRGDQASAACRVGLRLSSDDIITTSDPLLGSIMIAPLAAGERRLVQVFGEISASFSPGPRFAGAILDDTSLVAEAIESNNRRVGVPLVLGDPSALPDFTVDAPVLGATSVERLEDLAITTRVRNVGPVTGSITVYTMFTQDTVLDLNDYVVRQRTVTIPAGSSEAPVTIADQPPNGVTPGPWFVGAFLDPVGLVVESDKSNNISPLVPITVIPEPTLADLIPISLTVPSHALTVGQSFITTVSVRNDGGVASGSWIVAVLQDDRRDRILSSALTIGQVSTMTSVAPGEIATLDVPVTIGAISGSGDNYIGCEIFGTNNEVTGNNTIGDILSSRVDNPAIPVAVGVTPPGGSRVDLIPDGPTSVDRVLVDSGEVVTFTPPPIRNLGTGPAPPVRVGVYMVTAGIDYFLSGTFRQSGTEPIATWMTPTIASGDVATEPPLQIPLPSSRPPGTYAIGVWVDDTETLAEDRETNNDWQFFAPRVLVGSRPPGIDLAAVELVPGGATVMTGDQLQVTRIFKNRGRNPALAFDLTYVFSNDPALDSQDPAGGVVAFPGLLPGVSEGPSTNTVVVPEGLTPGTIYLGLAVDRGDAVAELDETNNTLVVPLTLQPGRRCDVDQDGMINITDVQAVIDVALGAPAGGREDLNGDGAVNVLDVSVGITAALGGGCP